MVLLYCGSALCEVDADGSVRLPEFLADTLGGDADNDLLLSPHEADACLVGYHRGHLQQLMIRAEQWRQADESAGLDARAHFRRSRHYFGVVEAARRVGGAIRIPEMMRHMGQIGSVALFVGAGDRFEIWNPDLALASDDAALRELTSHRLKIHRRRAPRKAAREPARARARRTGRAR